MIWLGIYHHASRSALRWSGSISVKLAWHYTIFFMEWGMSQIKWRAVPLLRASAQCSFGFLLHCENAINNSCHLPVHSSGDGTGAALLSFAGYAALHVVCLFDMLFLDMLSCFKKGIVSYVRSLSLPMFHLPSDRTCTTLLAWSETRKGKATAG